MDSWVAVGGSPTGSSSSSVTEWKLSSSLGGAGEPLVVVSCVSSYSKSNDQMKLVYVWELYKLLYCCNVLKRNCLANFTMS